MVTDEVDAVHERVRRAADGKVVQRPGGTRRSGDAYAFTAADPEGNLWTFGTYRGAA